MASRAPQQTIQPKPQRAPAARPADLQRWLETRAPSEAVITQAQTVPHVLSPRDVQHVQRVIGNRATARLFAGTTTPRASRDAAPKDAAPSTEAEASDVELRLDGGDALQASPAETADAGDKGGPVSTGIETAIRRELAAGQPLARDAQDVMGQAIGADFGGIRVHSGPGADQLSRSLNARAFASGSHLFFAAGEYAPATRDGRHLLAHELAHTVQQGAAPAQPRAQRDLAPVHAQSGLRIQRNPKKKRRPPQIAPPPQRLMISDGKEKSAPKKDESTEPKSPYETQGAVLDIANDILDVKDSYYELKKAQTTGEKLGAVGKGVGKSSSVVQNVSKLSGMMDDEGTGATITTQISAGAAIITAAAEAYKAFQEMREKWQWSFQDFWSNASLVGAFAEKVMDGLKGVNEIVKAFVADPKKWEMIPLFDTVKTATVVIQKTWSFWDAWTRFAKLKEHPAAKGSSTGKEKREVIDHLINLNWDQMKQSAWEILTAGLQMGGVMSKATGVGVMYGYMLEYAGKLAETGGKLYTLGLRNARESSWFSGAIVDKDKTAKKRDEIASKIKKFNLAYLYEAAGVAPSDQGDLEKIKEALEKPN